MANPEHVSILVKGVNAWNAWRQKKPSILADLSGVNFDRADLRGADLESVNLTGAKLSGANLYGAILSRADLTCADLTQADLAQADLKRACLKQANCNEAALGGVSFDGANLTHASLYFASFGHTVFADVDLSLVKGLEFVIHHGPSTIGIDTVYRSGGNIPHVFLRRAGVPEPFITYAKSLVGSAIEYYSLFISYSTADQEFAERLYADFQAAGVRCWFAPHHIQAGKKIHDQIDEAIRLHDKLLLILSPDSMKSSWVKTEISKARKREIWDKARVLFPVRLVPVETLRNWECFDADTGKDSAREIREFFIPDFSNWKDHDSYRKAFDRLVRDLEANSSR